MKLKLVRKGGEKPLLQRLQREWLVVGSLILAGLSFLGGMLFYRSGYASRISSALRRVPKSETVTEAIEEVAAELDNEVKLYQANGLANVFLDIPFDSMMALESKRQEALATGVLYASDDDFVPATLRYNNGQTLDVKLRLKGDWVDHLETDKWSLRVHITENDGAVLGMRRFSLQAPHTRGYVNEWGYIQTLLLEGILTPRYHFVNVIINGEHKGIYALEEGFHTDLLESQGRREGIIFRLDEDLLWRDWSHVQQNDYGIGNFWVVDTPLMNEISPYRERHIAASETLSAELVAAKELLYSFYRGLLPADQVLDEELWGRYFALTDLWGGGHGTTWFNNRLYYNPETGLLEPVAFDGFVFHRSFAKPKMAFPFAEDPFFNNLGVQKVYVKTLDRILRPEYLEMLQSEFGAEVQQYYDLLVEEYQEREYRPHDPSEPALELPWENLAFRAQLLRQNLNPPRPVRGNFRLESREGLPFLRLDVVNLMVLPVRIVAVVVDETVLPFEEGWCFDERCLSDTLKDDQGEFLLRGNNSSGVPTPFLLPAASTGVTEDRQEPLLLRVSIYGGSRTFDVPIHPGYAPQGIRTGLKPESTLEEALGQHKFLQVIGEQQLAIMPGDWLVSGDLVIPQGYDLVIPGNTTLRFEERAVFLAQGRVDIPGTEEAPVLLTAQTNSWGGMVVLNASQTSRWQSVKVEKMAGIARNGWILTGGITFYESSVEIAQSWIGNNTTEDALNVVRASFRLDAVEFANTSSDAVDGDFTTGVVTRCSFHDIGGDGLDVSGSQVTVKEAYFVNIGDKAISVGEESQVTIESITIRQVRMGIVSKDLSAVTVVRATIDSARVAGLAAYNKKPQYGPASIEAQKVKFTNVETPTLCQTGSQITLNGELVPGQEVDVDALYSQGQ